MQDLHIFFKSKLEIFNTFIIVFIFAKLITNILTKFLLAILIFIKNFLTQKL